MTVILKVQLVFSAHLVLSLTCISNQVAESGVVGVVGGVVDVGVVGGVGGGRAVGVVGAVAFVGSVVAVVDVENGTTNLYNMQNY